MITDVTIVYLPEFLYAMLDYIAMANGPGMPPPWNPIYDLNGDGFINVKDVLICLASLSF
jgi:hypothetical protein